MSGVQALECCCHYVGTLFYRPFDSRVGPQILRPINMPSGSWRDEVGGTNPWDSINDVVADDDVTYMQASITAGVGNFIEGTFTTNAPSPLPDKSQVHRITIRAKKVSGFSNIRVQIFNGVTLIATLPATSLTSAYVDYTYTLTPAEVAAIPANYAISFVIRSTNEFSTSTIPRVTQFFFEC